MRKEVKETTSFKSEDGSGALNGVSDDLNYRSRFSSLLASTHRDFLLSPTGQQVLPLPLSPLSYTYMFNSLDDLQPFFYFFIYF